MVSEQLARAAYIVPGFSHKTSEPAYVAIAEAFAARDITPVPIDIGWRRSTIPGYIREARRKIDAAPADEAYFVGFSLGAMCLLGAAPDIAPRTQILCSLMPLYAEDQSHHAWYMRAWAFRIYLGRPKVRYPSPNGEGWPRTIFVYGEQERRIIQRGVRDMRLERFPNSETIVVPDARHAIANETYLSTVLDLIAAL